MGAPSAPSLHVDLGRGKEGDPKGPPLSAAAELSLPHLGSQHTGEVLLWLSNQTGGWSRMPDAELGMEGGA